jgi:long-chain fatty acid transport protein
MRTTTRFIALGSVAYITLAGTTLASAGGFSTARFGGEHGNAASDSVTALYYNPAGIALAGGTHIYAEGLFAFRTVSYNRAAGAVDNPDSPSTPSDAVASNVGEAKLANPIVSPFVGVTTDAGKKGLGLGIGLYVPYGGQAKWNKNPDYEGNTTYPGAVDGQQRWAIIEGEQKSIYITAAAAYSTPHRQLAFGVGLNVIMTDIALDRARNALGTDDVASEGNALLEAKSTDLALGIGMIWRPMRKARIGVSYQSQPSFGQMELAGTLTTKFGSSAPNADPVVLLQRMPDVARISAEIDASETMIVRLGAEWQNWSVFDEQCLVPKDDPSRRCSFNPDGSIDTADTSAAQSVLVNLPRHYHDGWNVKAGGGWHNKKMEVSGSLQYDANVIPDETMDPSLFDMNKVIAQLGLDYSLGTVSLHFAVGEVYYMSRTVEARTVDPVSPSRNPDMAGTYKSNVLYGTVGVGVEL